MAGKIISIKVRNISSKPVFKKSAVFWLPAKKIVAAILIAASNWYCLPLVMPTLGYMTDVETSEPSIIKLGTLDFITASTTGDSAPANIKPGEKFARRIILQNTGSLPFQYGVQARKTAGDENACEFLQLEAFLGVQLQYRGGLINFATSSIEYATTTGEWEFDVSFPGGAVQNIGAGGNCSFEFVFTGWQLAPGEPKAGFSDEEIIANSIEILDDYPLVNVVYPNGGEYWYIVDNECVKYGWCRNWCAAHGMNDQCEYELLWNAEFANKTLLIDIWSSNDSGKNWFAKIADKVSNTGRFYWKIPYDTRFITDKARIKIVAYDAQDLSRWNWDQSDADYCPPLLSIEDLMNQTFDAPAAPADGDQNAGNSGSGALSAAAAVIVPMTIEEINRDINAIGNSTTSQAESAVEETQAEPASESGGGEIAAGENIVVQDETAAQEGADKIETTAGEEKSDAAGNNNEAPAAPAESMPEATPAVPETAVPEILPPAES